MGPLPGFSSNSLHCRRRNLLKDGCFIYKACGRELGKDCRDKEKGDVNCLKQQNEEEKYIEERRAERTVA